MKKVEASVIQDWLVDPVTGDAPPTEPWPGITWKVSYDGPLRSTYGITFAQLKTRPCPPYAFEPYG